MKRNSNKKLAWGLFSLTAAAIYFKHRIDSIGISLRNVSLVSVDQNSKTAALNLVVSVRYPLPFNTYAKRLTGTLYIQGARVATIDTIVNRYLQPDGENIINIPVTINYQQLAQGVWANIQTGNVRTLLIQLDARLTTNILPISIHKTLTWEDMLS